MITQLKLLPILNPQPSGRTRLCLTMLAGLNVLGGCHQSLSVGDNTTSLQQLAAVDQNRADLNLLDSKQTKSYRNELLTRLQSTMAPDFPCSQREFAILISQRSEPLALSIGEDQIVVSLGLLSKLRCEDELAFVIAHEIGHYCLGHLGMAAAAGSYEGIDERDKLELEADIFGVELISLAGFQPEASISAIAEAYGRRVDIAGTPEYPAVSERLNAIVERFGLTVQPRYRSCESREYRRFLSQLGL